MLTLYALHASAWALEQTAYRGAIIALDVARGLAYLHNAGITHLDIK